MSASTASARGGLVSKRLTIPVFVLTLVLVVVAVDVLFFRSHPWERLMANIGIVLVLGAFYLRFWRGA